MRALRGLRELNISRNILQHFPPELCQLPSLESLDVRSNRLESLELSAELFASGLPRLETLLLSDNRLVQLPPCLARCAALERLEIDSNRLVHTTAAGEAPLAGCTSLRTLSLKGNGLLQVPSIIALPLTELDLSANKLAALPAAIRQLGGTLTVLRLVDNAGLRALPPALGECTLLTQLGVPSGGTLRWPPAEVMSQPLPQILAYLRGHPQGMCACACACICS